MESKYRFSVNGLYGQITAYDAMKELERIRGKHGILIPSLVVEESRAEDAPLHKVFQWNDGIAAMNYREWQAAQLIRNIRIVVSDEEVSVTTRAIVNVSTSDNPHRTYVPVAEAIHDETAYEDLLKQAKAEMETFIAKYNQIAELNAVKRQMLSFINGIE